VWTPPVIAFPGATEASRWLVSPRSLPIGLPPGELPAGLRALLPAEFARDAIAYHLPAEWAAPAVPLAANSAPAADPSKPATSPIPTGQRPLEGIRGAGSAVLPYLLGILVASGVLLFARKGAPVLSFLEQRESVAWIALGLFWWLALRPSAFGFAIVVWGLFAAVRLWLRDRASAAAAQATSP
jgi:hypothetical protein